MANVNTKTTAEKLKQQAMEKQQNQNQNQIQHKNQVPSKQGDTFKGFMNSPAVKNRIEEVLKNRATQFNTSLISIVSNDTNLRDAEPTSVLAAAMKAAVLDLPIEPNFGYAWIIARNDKNAGCKIAQFQMGYKGYIQLALRSNQYEKINVVEVYEGELISFNRLTEEFIFDQNEKTSDVVIGYAAYFKLKNGFSKTVYWTKEQVEKHKNKFSKSEYGWAKDWHAMAMKTVLTSLLKRWGILSVDLQQAIIAEEEPERKEINDEFSDMDFPFEREGNPEIIDAAAGQ